MCRFDGRHIPIELKGWMCMDVSFLILNGNELNVLCLDKLE